MSDNDETGKLEALEEIEKALDERQSGDRRQVDIDLPRELERRSGGDRRDRIKS